MSQKLIYSCDWCQKDSPTPGFVGPNWERCEGNWLCGACYSVRRTALRDAYAKCSAPSGRQEP
jgi:hypothetical protein